MSWAWTKRLLVVGGTIYAFTLIPAAIRPSWSAAPFRKPDQTITVEQGVSRTALNSKIKNACTAAVLVRPVVGSAHNVRVVTVTTSGKPVSVKQVACELYV